MINTDIHSARSLTHPTHYAKWHPDPISHSSTIHWTHTDRQSQNKRP